MADLSTRTAEPAGGVRTAPEAEPRFDLANAPGHLIRRAAQRHNALWAEIVGGELTSVQFAVLALLQHEPDVDQRTLSERLSIDTSTLADVCKRLSDRDLIARERASDDSRRYEISLTATGAELLSTTQPAVIRVGERLVEGLDDVERETLLSLLRRTL